MTFGGDGGRDDGVARGGGGGGSDGVRRSSSSMERKGKNTVVCQSCKNKTAMSLLSEAAA